jgi:hypothetical protein
MPGQDMRARAKEIIAALRRNEAGSDEVFIAFEELDALPVEVVREALAAWAGPAPDLDDLDDATRKAHGFPPRPLRLRTLAVVTDADVLDLGPVAEEQLRLAGKSWDGLDLAPEERLDGEMEGSFAGTLEHRVLGEGEQPLFDVLRYAGDAGVVYRAGTRERLGMIADGRVEMADRCARVAIEEALAAAPSATPIAEPALELAPSPTPTSNPKTAAPKKKTTAPKKKAATKKKTTAKKADAPKAKSAAGGPKKKRAAAKKTSK